MSSDLFWAEDPRSFLMLEGPDAAGYLQSQLSQDLGPLGVGASAYALALEPAGKVVALARITRTGEESFVLDTDPAAGEALTARLARFKIRVRAELTPVAWSCIAVRGPGADGVAAPGSGWKVAAWRGDGTAVDLLGPSVSPPDGIRAGTAGELLGARIEAAWPVAGVDHEIGGAIPAALGVTAEAVCFTKGCYPGQELVERMDSRGANAPRTLHAIDVAAGTQPGTDVDVDGTAARVTSVAGTRALALVRR